MLLYEIEETGFFLIYINNKLENVNNLYMQGKEKINISCMNCIMLGVKEQWKKPRKGIRL